MYTKAYERIIYGLGFVSTTMFFTIISLIFALVNKKVILVNWIGININFSIFNTDWNFCYCYILMIYNFDFRKSLGQNFLIDDSIVDNIANAIDYKENNMIIEIGPGSGNLTKKLLKKADFVLLYEIDTRLKKILSRELLEFNNYDIIWDDFYIVMLKKI